MQQWAPPNKILLAEVITAPAFTGGRLIYPRGGWLLGATMTNEIGGATVVTTLFDGADVNGDMLDKWVSAVIGTQRLNPGAAAWPLESGLFITTAGGTIDLAFTVGVWQ